MFPQEPLLRVEGNLIECQLAETLILNTINFQSLIATKAARIKQAAGGRSIIDFGLRRAQGLGGIHASRAAVIGGADSTSNVLAAFQDGLKATGTQAHSWIQSYENELEAYWVQFNHSSWENTPSTFKGLMSKNSNDYLVKLKNILFSNDYGRGVKQSAERIYNHYSTLFKGVKR